MALAAHSDAAVRDVAAAHLAYLASHPGVSLHAWAYAVAPRAQLHRHRVAAVVESREEALTFLREVASGARAGTKSSVPSVTSHTRWRAPADPRCIATVMPSAATSISVAFASSSSIGVFHPGSAAISEMSVGVTCYLPL